MIQAIREQILINENFMISVNKEELSNMNWPISFKLTLTKVNYEKKR